jgi:hypothetical protein
VTLQERDVWDDMDTDLIAKPSEDTAPKSPPLIDDDNSASMFTTVRRTEASEDTTVPSFEVGKQIGDGGHHLTGTQEGGSLEEEPVDYEPSPIREKDEEKSPHQEDDVYSLSRLSLPRPSLHKV